MQTKKVPTWLSAILVIICAAFMCYSLYLAGRMASSAPLIAASLIPGILIYLVAIFYCVAGYKKDAAVLFKIYSLLLALGALIPVIFTITGSSSSTASTLSAVLLTIHCVICLIFTFGKNLGKKKSFILYGISLVLCLIVAILSIIAFPYSWALYIGLLASLLIFGIMLYGKYADKDSRGTV